MLIVTTDPRIRRTVNAARAERSLAVTAMLRRLGRVFRPRKAKGPVLMNRALANC